MAYPQRSQTTPVGRSGYARLVAELSYLSAFEGLDVPAGAVTALDPPFVPASEDLASDDLPSEVLPSEDLASEDLPSEDSLLDFSRLLELFRP